MLESKRLTKTSTDFRWGFFNAWKIFLVWTSTSFFVCSFQAKIRQKIEGKRQKSYGVCLRTWETNKLIMEDAAGVHVFVQLFCSTFFLLFCGSFVLTRRKPLDFHVDPFYSETTLFFFWYILKLLFLINFWNYSSYLMAPPGVYFPR